MSVIGSLQTVTPNRLQGMLGYIKENPECEKKSLEQLFGDSAVAAENRLILEKMGWVENNNNNYFSRNFYP